MWACTTISYTAHALSTSLKKYSTILSQTSVELDFLFSHRTIKLLKVTKFSKKIDIDYYIL
jgi:hypothetical protein